MNWAIGILLDLVLLAIVLLFFRRGKKDGFAKTVVSFFGFLIALVIAYSLCAPVTNRVYESFVRQPAQQAVETAIRNRVGQTQSETAPDSNKLYDALEESVGHLPGFVQKKLAVSEKRTALTAQLGGMTNLDIKTASVKITETIIRPAAVAVLRVVVFFLLFIVMLLLCALLAKLLKFVNKIPLLGGVNAVLGGLIGVVKGLILVLIISWGVSLLCSDGGRIFGVITEETVNSSLILKFLASLRTAL